MLGGGGTDGGLGPRGGRGGGAACGRAAGGRRLACQGGVFTDFAAVGLSAPTRCKYCVLPLRAEV